MKRAIYVLAMLIPIAMIVGAVSLGFTHLKSARASTCTPTGFIRDSMNLTAAVIPTTLSPNVTGTVNASGCNIGVYYGPGITGSVSNAEIFGANYYGIVNNAGNVMITNSRIHDIGENPLNGDQHGVGIYFAFEGNAKGSITNNLIWNYQKGGIVVNGVGSNANVNHNTVIGQGPISYIAQNGIQIGFGAKANVSNNIVTGNSYTGAGLTASGGIIVVGGSCYGGALTIGTKIQKNIVVGNDIGIWLSNLDGSSCIPTLTPTKIIVKGNISTNDGINNTTGNGPGAGYQAGIADQGDLDQIINNSICGTGYTPVVTPPPYLFLIDVTVTNSPTVSGNTSCLDGSPVSFLAARSALHAKKHARMRIVN
jgi:hypothetical protein